jgi:hypothetical protein
VAPTGIVVPYLTAEGAAVTLPLGLAGLPVIDISNEPAPTTVAPTEPTEATTPPTTVALVAAAAPLAASGGGGGSTGLVVGGAVAVVGIGGGTAALVRMRRPRTRSRRRDRHRPDQPHVRPVHDTGHQRATKGGPSTVMGMRVVQRAPSTTTITRTGGSDAGH